MFFKDLLKVEDPEKIGISHYSQARVYLFLTVIVLFAMAGASYFITINNRNFQYSLDTIFWLAIFFGSYALIGKGMKYQYLQKILSFKNKLSPDVSEKVERELS